MKFRYNIGGICVEMKPRQAARWNAGETTIYDLRSIRVYLATPGNHYRMITLQRATSERLEAETASQIFGMPCERQ